MERERARAQREQLSAVRVPQRPPCARQSRDKQRRHITTGRRGGPLPCAQMAEPDAHRLNRCRYASASAACWMACGAADIRCAGTRCLANNTTGPSRSRPLTGKPHHAFNAHVMAAWKLVIGRNCRRLRRCPDAELQHRRTTQSADTNNSLRHTPMIKATNSSVTATKACGRHSLASSPDTLACWSTIHGVSDKHMFCFPASQTL